MMAGSREQRIEQAVVDRMRPLLALRHLSAIYDRWQETMSGWLRALPGPDEWDDVVDTLDLTVASDGTRIMVRAAGPSARMIPGMLEFFGDVGADPVELERLARVGELLQPTRVGSWLELWEERADAGWWLPIITLEELEPLLDGKGQWRALRKWAAPLGVDLIDEAGRSVAPGKGQAMLALPMPGEDAMAQVNHALDLFQALGAARPPDADLAALMNEPLDGLDLQLRLAPDGVLRSGLRARRPALSALVALSEAHGEESLDLTAQVQGLLLQDDPWAVEVNVGSDGVELATTWLLSD